MLINTLDARAAYGFALDSAPGWLDAPERQTPSAAVLRRGGLRPLDVPRDQSRQIVLRGNVMGTSVQDARDKIDALKLALSKNTGAQITFDDALTRYVIARCTNFRVPPYGPSMLQSKVQVEATMIALDPYSYSTTLGGPLALDVSANHPLPGGLGTGPSRPIITLTGAMVNPLLRMYASDAATILGSMQLTVTMIAGDTLVIDCDAKTIKFNGVNRLDFLTTGDFFVFDPLIEPDPRLYLSTGTGSFIWRKAWR